MLTESLIYRTDLSSMKSPWKCGQYWYVFLVRPFFLVLSSYPIKLSYLIYKQVTVHLRVASSFAAVVVVLPDHFAKKYIYFLSTLFLPHKMLLAFHFNWNRNRFDLISNVLRRRGALRAFCSLYTLHHIFIEDVIMILTFVCNNSKKE